MLTTDMLLKLNRSMLGLGAPIALDGQGYNQVDYSMMEHLADRTSLSDAESYRLVTSLSHYRKTQLKSYDQEITETLNHLASHMNLVKVVAFTGTTVSISWRYNKTVSEFIKQSMSRNDIRWNKDKNGNWVLTVKWNAINPLLTALTAEGFSICQVEDTRKSLDTTAQDTTPAANVTIAPSVTTGNTKEVFKAEPIKKVTKTTRHLSVIRSKETVDTLEVKFDYHSDIVSVLHTVAGSYYVSKKKLWHVYIDQAADLYDKLQGLSLNIDLTELAPWKDTVKSWDVDYEMKDIPTHLPFTPYDFQINDIKALLKGKRLLNGNDMGCGKTFEDVMVGYSIPLPKLVICPPSLRLNWMKEIKMVDPTAEVVVLQGSDEFQKAEWTVMGYTSVSKYEKELEKANFQVVFIDEAHYCQAINAYGQPDSQRAKAVARVVATAGWVYPTTGTPKTNRNKNLYNLLRMVHHPLTRGRMAWKNYGMTYCDAYQGNWGWNFDGNSNDLELNDQLNPYMVRHLKSEVLPNLVKVRRSIPVKVDLREYDQLIAEYLNKRSKKDAEQSARLMRARMVLATQKVGETISLAKELMEDGEKVVLVTCFTEVVKVLEKAFAGNCAKIVGGMSDKQKDAAITDFQTGNTQVMILNIIAGGVGVTLTASHNLIINDYDFVPGNIIQVEDRICRSGQKEVSNIYYMTAQGADVEENFVQMLTYKSDTINQAIDGGNGESIDFISLVEQSAGITRSDKVRKAVHAEEVTAVVSQLPTTQATKSTPKAATKKSSTTSWTQFTTEELEGKAHDLGVTIKHYDDPRIYRMRLVMALKKAM